MKSKSLILLSTLAAFVTIQYGMDAWVLPMLHNYAASGRDGGFGIAGSLISVFNGLHMMLWVGTLAVMILLARSVADVFAGRGQRHHSV